MEEEKPQISIKSIIRYIIIGVIVILVLAFLFRLGSTASSKNKDSYKKEEVMSEDGHNYGQLDYQRRYLARTGSWCEIHGRYTDGGKVNIRILAEKGWGRFDIVNMRYFGEYVNVKMLQNGLYLWQNDANPKYGYFYKIGSPSYSRILELLAFDDIDLEKTKFECEDRSSYVNYLSLPNVEWE